MMYATARFNASVTACRFGNTEDMAASRRQSLEYIEKFSKYMSIDA